MYDATLSVIAYSVLLGKSLIANLENCNYVAFRSSSKSDSSAVLRVIPGCSETTTAAAISSSTQSMEDSLEWAVVNRKNKLVKSADAPLPSSLSSSSLVCASNFNIAKLKAA